MHAARHVFGSQALLGGGLADLQDVSQLPKITAWLLRKGYSEKQIAGIWGGNLLRVMQRAQDHAAKAAVAKP